jgi:hypothetical protein
LPPVPPGQTMVIALAGDCTWLTYVGDIKLRPAE